MTSSLFADYEQPQMPLKRSRTWHSVLSETAFYPTPCLYIQDTSPSHSLHFLKTHYIFFSSTVGLCLHWNTFIKMASCGFVIARFSFYPSSSQIGLMPLATLLDSFLLWLKYLFYSDTLYRTLSWHMFSPSSPLTDPSTTARNSANMDVSQICFSQPRFLQTCIPRYISCIGKSSI